MMQLLAIRVVLALSFLIAIILSFRADQGLLLPVLFTFLLVLLWILVGFLNRRGITPAWALTIAVLNFLLVIPELALRVTNFHYESGVQFGWPRPRDFLTFQADPDLLWKYPPGKSGANSFGFLEREITSPKPRDVYRIIFLGDSVTEQGYPALIQSRLNRAMSGGKKRVEAINLGISGYSSYQGRKVAELYGAHLQADLAVVYFGWNDHWQAYGSIDSKKVIRRSDYEGWKKQFLILYHNSRLLQWLNQKTESFTKSSGASLKQTRVPEWQYAQNLKRIHRVLEANGTDVLFLTAPTSLYKVPMPSYLVERGFVPGQEECNRRHRKYNQLVRNVATQTNSNLLDLEKYFEALPAQDLSTLFVDGIHFSPAGLNLLANQIATHLQAEIRKDLSAPELVAP